MTESIFYIFLQMIKHILCISKMDRATIQVLSVVDIVNIISE